MDFGNEILKDTLNEYLVLYFQLSEKIEIHDMRIVELSQLPEYKERVDKLIISASSAFRLPSRLYALLRHTAEATLLGHIPNYPLTTSALRFDELTQTAFAKTVLKISKHKNIPPTLMRFTHQNRWDCSFFLNG